MSVGTQTYPTGALTPDTWAEQIESFERINSIRETNRNFDSCAPCKQLGTSRLHQLHESKFTFVSRIEFIRSKLSNLSAHVSGAPSVRRWAVPRDKHAHRQTRLRYRDWQSRDWESRVQLITSIGHGTSPPNCWHNFDQMELDWIGLDFDMLIRFWVRIEICAEKRSINEGFLKVTISPFSYSNMTAHF